MSDLKLSRMCKINAFLCTREFGFSDFFIGFVGGNPVVDGAIRLKGVRGKPAMTNPASTVLQIASEWRRAAALLRARFRRAAMHRWPADKARST